MFCYSLLFWFSASTISDLSILPLSIILSNSTIPINSDLLLLVLLHYITLSIPLYPIHIFMLYYYYLYSYQLSIILFIYLFINYSNFTILALIYFHYFHFSYFLFSLFSTSFTLLAFLSISMIPIIFILVRLALLCFAMLLYANAILYIYLVIYIQLFFTTNLNKWRGYAILKFKINTTFFYNEQKKKRFLFLFYNYIYTNHS